MYVHCLGEYGTCYICPVQYCIIVPISSDIIIIMNSNDQVNGLVKLISFLNNVNESNVAEVYSKEDNPFTK